MNDKSDKPPPKSFREEVVDSARTIGLGLLLALVLRVVLFEPFTIPSASMEPGLLVGDYVIATKWDYGWSRASIPFNLPLFRGRVFEQAPARGDVVVFKLPSNPQVTYVKRLIGLPGDRVQVSEGRVYVNGEPIARTPAGDALDPDADMTVAQYAETNARGHTYMTFDRGPNEPLDNTEVFVVPEGHYFMMGDNRDNSSDSRVPPAMNGVGFVPAENLIGRPRFILASWKGGAEIFKPWTWVMRFDPGRLLKPVG
ncbi:signal peptidase I [Phenylobacterium sp.]|uniref:signal peptidase I n=1 Tax=Phenylobacterium sp. TaxID=1871053 RepID=UPI0025FB8023|nr:signal peptidase I [Phenylobacterium sp.]MBX3485952.1 signal peptidase I [Phenylobacterium sp.]